MQKPTSEEQQKHYFLIKKQFADTGIRLHPQPDIRYPAFRYPLRCNEHPVTSQRDTECTATGIRLLHEKTSFCINIHLRKEERAGLHTMVNPCPQDLMPRPACTYQSSMDIKTRQKTGNDT
jgi:hypothetical protein